MFSHFFAIKVHQRKKVSFPFQFLFSLWISTQLNGQISLQELSPHVKFCTWLIDGEKCKVANTFQDAAIHFFSKPFMDQEDVNTQPDKHFFDDATVNHSVVTNSSIWVIGPYMSEDEDGNASKNWLYYQIAAAITF